MLYGCINALSLDAREACCLDSDRHRFAPMQCNGSFMSVVALLGRTLMSLEKLCSV